MQYLDRSTLANWVKYMAHNPHYFAYVFRVPLTEKNLEAAAAQIFGKSHVLWEPTLIVRKYVPQRAPTIHGVVSIGRFLGIRISQTYFLIRHGSMPVWKEGKQLVAYKGKLERWASNRQVGRFNK